jgi:hypothetical protein
VTSLLVSVTAIFISLLVARRQHQIQEQQLKKDLFDRRYKVYTGTREFANYVRSGPDAMEMTHPHFGLFVDLIERAEMLFGSAVHSYLKNLDSLARKLYVNAKKQRTRPSDPDLIDAGQKLFEEFEDLYRRRNEVFKPFLKLDSA